MSTFSDILKSYFVNPYRPEFLVKKVKDWFKEQNLIIAQESNNIIIQDSYNKLFFPIFKLKDYKFKDKVETAKSLDNFKNFIYESCKSDYNNIKKDVILSYIFILDEFKDRIINAIYQACQDGIKDDFFTKLLDILK